MTPDDLAFATIGASASVSPFVSEPQRLQFLFKALWDFLFSVEILKREYADRNFLARAILALFGGKDTREAQLLLQLTISRDAEGETLSSKMLDLIKEIELAAELEQARITGKATIDSKGLRVNQVALLQLITNVAKKFPDTLKHKYFVLVDDLDLHWNDTPEQNAFLGALLLSVRRMHRPPNLKFVVSMRDSILSSISIEDKDKFRDFVCRVSWTKEDVLHMIEKRIAYVFSCEDNEVFEHMFVPGAFNKMWRHTMGMPRELLRLASLACSTARDSGARSVEEEHLRQAILQFSNERREDIASQHRAWYPGLELVFQKFRGGHREFSLAKLNDVCIQLAMEIEEKAPASRGYVWAKGFLDDPIGFAQILLKTSFLMLKENRTASPIIVDRNVEAVISRDSWFSIHPMYCPGLSIIDSAS